MALQSHHAGGNETDNSAQAEAVSDQSPRYCRRNLRRATILWFVAVNVPLLALLGLTQSKPSQTPVFGVQLHLHGSLSEGPGSMAGHNFVAKQFKGVIDAIWWTDHDWRIAAYTYVDHFDFEDNLVIFSKSPGQGQGEDSVRQSWDRQQVDHSLNGFEANFTAQQARMGEKSLRVQATAAKGDWQQLRYVFRTDRNREISSLAMGVKLKLAVFPEAIGADARVVLSVLLSQHPPDYRGRIDYVITTDPAAYPASQPTTTAPVAGDEIPVRVVPVNVAARAGQWNDLEIDLSNDAERLQLGGADNSATEISLAFEARNGAPLLTHIDAFQIERRVTGQELLDWQRKTVAQFGDNPVNYVGQEISFGSHTNAYGVKVPLADQKANPNGLEHEAAVRFVHEHGGIISLNHVYGPGGLAGVRDHTKAPENQKFERITARLREQHCYGADLLEVGYLERYYSLSAFTQLWDLLSSDQTYITGIGVSDSHSNTIGWMKGPNNWITWVYAKSIAEDDLIEGLRTGRAYCGDPTRFNGRLDIVTPEGFQMGQVVVTKHAKQQVTVRVEGGREGQKARIYCDGKGLSEHELVDGHLEQTFEIATDKPAFVRFELRDQRGVFALSNPLYFAPSAPKTYVAPGRLIEAP